MGDSNSKGKIESLISDVEGLIRTLRADLQDKIGSPVSLDSPVVGRARRLHFDKMSGSPARTDVSAREEGAENPLSHVAI